MKESYSSQSENVSCKKNDSNYEPWGPTKKKKK